MSRILKKSLSMLLALSLIFTFVSALAITANAAGTSVEIVSFVRGSRDDLRSSELLEARVTGYDGNISDLIFEWDNQVQTYLYVYNSSNMYNIKDTAGEVEVPGAVSFLFGLITTPGESFAGEGYAWAAVYGANLSNSSLSGTITVTVKDKNGNVLGTDSYKNFDSPSLKSDLEATNYGVFKGETINLKDMLGRSSIVHIDCTACSVSKASTSSSNITLTESADGYLVYGKARGVAEASLTVQKQNCKFHQYSGQETITNKIYVFEKPNTSTTTTTLTLTNLDENCEYFIGNVQGTKSADGKSIVFTGLNPDTTYEVTVRGNYESGYAYAYVTDTTKPMFIATVNFYTDNVLSSTLEYFGLNNSLYVREINSSDYIALENTTTGIYTAGVDNGIYYLYCKRNGNYVKFNDFQLTIDNKNSTVNVYTYSVKYDANGGSMTQSGGVYYIDSPVYITENIPVKSGSFFKHWVDEKGNIYTPGQLLTSAIAEPKVLTAVWEDAIDIKVNVTINHGDNYVTPAENVTVSLVETSNKASVPAGKEITITPTTQGYAYSFKDKTTTYTANEPTFKDLKDSTYTVSCAKTGYSVQSITTSGEVGEDKVIDVVLVYDPSNFDLQFKVKMADEIPSSLYPVGANVRVTFWGYNEDILGWHTIVQHRGNTAAVPVTIDKTTGVGTGYYPVWNVWADAPTEPYYYRIIVDSYILSDGTIVTNNANAYKSTVAVENGGAVPTYPDGSNADVKGAFYSNESQNGTPVATISIDSYKLTFDANGGKINGKNTLVLNNQLIIPDTTEYKPTRDGGYTFTGWYTDSAFTTKATAGSRIYNDTTLYAGWNEPLSINGKVSVEGFYYQDGKKVEVLDVDRATEIVVTLQAFRNGKYNDIMSSKQELLYDNNDVATVNYNFTEIPDADSVEYRISTALINYTTSYDNNGDKNFADSEYTANFAGGKTATVDALLNFKADEFSQYYIVDATAIGEGFRPSTGITKILFQTTGSNPPNTVISQHTVEPYGEVLNFNDNGVADGSIMLWKGISNGAMSSYQLKLSSLDGEEYNSESPYSVRYGNASSWNGLARDSEVLIATLAPKEYKVNFDLNAGDDSIGNMELYASANGYFTTHKWSHDTEIIAKPTREGYVFAGWTCDEAGVFDGTYVDASVEKDVTLKAVWADFNWTTDTDAGYFENGNGQKESVIRFLFDIALNDEMKANIVETGIKYINSKDILEQVENVQFVGASITGVVTTFYGDIVDIDESKAGSTYHAIAYVKIGDKYYWSHPVSCKPVFNDLIIYED